MPKKQKVATGRPKQAEKERLQKRNLNGSSDKKVKQKADNDPVNNVEEPKKTRGSKKVSQKNAQKPKIPNKSNEVKELPVETGSIMNISAVEKVHQWLQDCIEEPEDVLSNSSVELWREEVTDIIQKRQKTIFPDEFFENLGVQIHGKKEPAKNKDAEDRRTFFAKLNLGSSHELESSSKDEDSFPLTGTHTGTQNDEYFSTFETQSKFQTGTTISNTLPYTTEYETETQSNLQTGSGQTGYETCTQTYTHSNLQTGTQSGMQTRFKSAKTDSCVSQSKTSGSSNRQLNSYNKSRKSVRTKSVSRDNTDDGCETFGQSAKKSHAEQKQTSTKSPVFRVPRSLKKGKKPAHVSKTSTRLYGNHSELESLPLSDIKPVKGKLKRRSSEGDEMNSSNTDKQPKTLQVKKKKKTTMPLTSTRLFEDTGYTGDMTEQIVPNLSSIRQHDGGTVTERTPNQPTEVIPPKPPRKGLRVKSGKTTPTTLTKLFDRESKDIQNATKLSNNDHAQVTPIDPGKCKMKTSTPNSKDEGQKFNFEMDISSVNQDISDDSSIGLYIEPSEREVNSQEIVCQSESITLVEKNHSVPFENLCNQRKAQAISGDYHFDDTCRRDISKSFHFGRQNMNSKLKIPCTLTQQRAWISMNDNQKCPVSQLPFFVKKESGGLKKYFANKEASFIRREDVSIDILCLLSIYGKEWQRKIE